ncbi:hypothetical protein EXS70_05045 [Candidatus Peribacteria bacterium]|nr:hypothetical protein [Candidatus Peribacteria bacterium]
MFPFLTKKKNPHDTWCLVCHIIVTVVLLLASIVSLLGTFMAHYNTQESVLVFGSMAGSLSLIALGVCLALWMNAVKNCMSQCDVCKPNAKK